MENVDVTMIVVVSSGTHKKKYVFSDDWVFQVDRFYFKKISDGELQVSFAFEAPVIIKENGRCIIQCPSEFMEEFGEFEEEIEKILDLISLDIGVSFNIKPDSYSFFSKVCRDGEVKNVVTLVPGDLGGLEKRLHYLNSNQCDGSVLNALRLYRQAKENDEHGHVGMKIYSALEQLFGKVEIEKLMNPEELRKLRQCIRSCGGVLAEKEDGIIRALENRDSQSMTNVLAQRMDLVTNTGAVSMEDKIKFLKEFKSCRHASAHGEIIPKRKFETEILLWQSADLVRHYLENKIFPQMKAFILGKKEFLTESFTDKHGALINNLGGGYFSLAISQEDISIYEEYLPLDFVDTSSLTYIITHNIVKLVSKSGITEVSIEEVPEGEIILVKEIQKKLSGVSESISG